MHTTRPSPCTDEEPWRARAAVCGTTLDLMASRRARYRQDDAAAVAASTEPGRTYAQCAQHEAHPGREHARQCRWMRGYARTLPESVTARARRPLGGLG